jgi:hypothetical protein
MGQAIVLRKFAGRFTACYRGFGMRLTSAADQGPSLSSIAFGLALLLIPVIAVIGVLALAIHQPGHIAGQSLAMSLVAAKSLREQRANLAKQADEILNTAAAEKRNLTDEENTRFDAYHTEMEQIRGQYERIERQEAINAELAESRGRQAGGREQPGAGESGRTGAAFGGVGSSDRAAASGWSRSTARPSAPRVVPAGLEYEPGR